MQSSNPDGRISVGIIDSQPLICSGLQRCLPEFGLEVSDCISDPAEWEEDRILSLAANVVLLDARFHGVDNLFWIGALRATHGARQAILVNSAIENPVYVARAVVLGADNFLLKTASPKQLALAIRTAIEKRPLAADSLFEHYRKQLQVPTNDEMPGETLTRREVQVLKHIALGLSNREIASSLSVSLDTVKEHVQNVLRKLHVEHRAAAAVWAHKRRLVDATPPGRI